MTAKTRKTRQSTDLSRQQLLRLATNYDAYLHALTKEIRRLVKIVEKAPLKGKAAIAWDEFHRNATEMTELLNKNVRAIFDDIEPGDRPPPVASVH